MVSRVFVRICQLNESWFAVGRPKESNSNRQTFSGKTGGHGDGSGIDEIRVQMWGAFSG